MHRKYELGKEPKALVSLFLVTVNLGVCASRHLVLCRRGSEFNRRGAKTPGCAKAFIQIFAVTLRLCVSFAVKYAHYHK